MIKHFAARSKDTATATFIMGRGFLLQRKCACGHSACTRGEQDEYARKKVFLQYESADDRVAGDVSPSSTRKTPRCA